MTKIKWGILALFLLGMVPSTAFAQLSYTTGLDVWLDAQDVNGSGDNSGLSDGDAVVTWANKGSVTNAEAVIQNPPTLAIGGGPGGLDAINFTGGFLDVDVDGSGTLVRRSQSYHLPDFMDSTDYSIFVVAFDDLSTDLPGHDAIFWDRGKNLTPDPANPLNNSRATTVTFLANAGAFNQDGWSHTSFQDTDQQFGDHWAAGLSIAQSSPGTLPHVQMDIETGEVGGTFFAHNDDWSPSGTTDQPTDSGADGIPTIGDFPNRAGSHAFGGRIAEILFYDHAVTGANRDAVVGYLNDKYGLVPEPSSLLLLASGLLAMAARRKTL